MKIPTTKAAVDACTIEELLKLVRFLPTGHSFFTRPLGAYSLERLTAIKEKDPAAYTAASKRVGWGRP